jgi:hypothetical protein
VANCHNENIPFWNTQVETCWNHTHIETSMWKALAAVCSQTHEVAQESLQVAARHNSQVWPETKFNG